jgi:hypothetical protein
MPNPDRSAEDVIPRPPTSSGSAKGAPQGGPWIIGAVRSSRPAPMTAIATMSPWRTRKKFWPDARTSICPRC